MSTLEIKREVEAFFSGDIRVSQVGSRIAILTPEEYPSGDGVVVYAADYSEYVIVSDLSSGETELSGLIGQSRINEIGKVVARQLDVQYDKGTLFLKLEPDAVGEACSRVAQASARLASIGDFLRPGPKAPSDHGEMTTLIAEALAERGIKAKQGEKLEGISGHVHQTSLFLPHREMVIEPISGQNQWPRASSVFAEFHDLSEVNGYKFLAVLDDREGTATEQAERLLSGVSKVGAWSEHHRWLPELA